MWWVRFFKFLLFYPLRPKVHYLAEAEMNFRVWPNDLDVNMHMNNGVYLSIMDFGRYDLSARSGFLKTVTKMGVYPVVASQMIRYRRSLGPFTKFSLRTKFLGWDDRFFYIQQKFVVKNEVRALAVVKARFLSQKDKKGVDPSKILMAYDASAVSPKLPAWILDWSQSEEEGWQEEKRSSTMISQ